MNWLEALTTIVATIGLRFVLPIVATFGIIIVLRKLDTQWQAEAEVIALPVIEGPRCYDVRKCSAEQRENCSAAKKSEPCWQIFRQTNNGLLKEECLSCGYFTNAVVTAPVGD